MSSPHDFCKLEMIVTLKLPRDDETAQQRCLLPSLSPQVQHLEPMWWKENTNLKILL